MKIFKNTFYIFLISMIAGCSSDDSNGTDSDDDTGGNPSGTPFGQYQIDILNGDLEGTSFSGEFTEQEGAAIYFEDSGTGNPEDNKLTINFTAPGPNPEDFVFSGNFILQNNDQEVVNFGNENEGTISLATIHFDNGGTYHNFFSMGGGITLTEMEVGPMTAGTAPASVLISFLGVFNSSANQNSYDVSGAIEVQLPNS